MEHFHAPHGQRGILQEEAYTVLCAAIRQAHHAQESSQEAQKGKQSQTQML